MLWKFYVDHRLVKSNGGEKRVMEVTLSVRSSDKTRWWSRVDLTMLTEN